MGGAWHLSHADGLLPFVGGNAHFSRTCGGGGWVSVLSRTATPPRGCLDGSEESLTPQATLEQSNGARNTQLTFKLNAKDTFLLRRGAD